MKERIYQIMQSEKMTQREFATALGISPSSLSSIFNGHTSPTNNTVQAIHRRFPEVSITWLMFGEGEMMSDGGEMTDSTPAEQGESVRPTEPAPATAALDDAKAADQLAQAMAQGGQVVIREIVKYTDKPQRKITKILVFYDDGTFDTFEDRVG